MLSSGYNVPLRTAFRNVEMNCVLNWLKTFHNQGYLLLEELEPIALLDND